VGAHSLGLRIEVFNASTEGEIDTAFAALSARRLGALLMAGHPLFTNRRDRIIALAARYRVPTMYTVREFASDGGLITYGPDLSGCIAWLAAMPVASSGVKSLPTCRCYCRPSSR
jgi:putative tryptophan/tyrosine transport system substrate-binding protein